MLPHDATAPENETATAARLMAEFAARTGLTPAAPHPRRYLWTDAFAVLNFLELHARSGDESNRRSAIELIDQVHQVLGRYRSDDLRGGWISGLDEEAGRQHPTAGGLRIGKPLSERDADEAMDERLESDRDGQYFHYLTKWIHALCQAGFATRDPIYARYAVELAEAAFQGFLRRSGSGDVIGLSWKMSTDLSRPLVQAMGMHDALDGFITFREAQHAVGALAGAAASDLDPAITTLFSLCRDRDWTTDDPLGLGGLLFDACRLARLFDEERFGDVQVLTSLLNACGLGLMGFLSNRSMEFPAAYRLAFRELGLAIGLKGLPILIDFTRETGPALQQVLDQLLTYESLGGEIVGAWLAEAGDHESWQSHQDINDVMLATALIPDMFLSVGERTPLPS